MQGGDAQRLLVCQGFTEMTAMDEHDFVLQHRGREGLLEEQCVALHAPIIMNLDR